MEKIIMSSDNIKTANVENFESIVLNSDIPVVVDFWAPWCGPCKAIAPMLDQAAEDYAGDLKIVKVNVDENRSLAVKYGVRSIPMLILFKNGNKANQVVGALNRNKFDSFVG